MISRIKRHTTKHVAIAGVMLVGFAFLLGDLAFGVSATLGALFALLNWFAIAWIAQAFLGTAESSALGGAPAVTRNRARSALFGVLKVGLLLLVCWGLFTRFGVQPIGFCFGMSAMVLGVLFASITVSTIERAHNASTNDPSTQSQGG